MAGLMDLPTLWLAVADTASGAREPALPVRSRRERSRDYDPEGLLWSYAEVAERVTWLIEHYAAAGYGHGHRVSLVLENRPAFMLHFLALNALGCWVVPLNPEFRHDDLDLCPRPLGGRPDRVACRAHAPQWSRPRRRSTGAFQSSTRRPSPTRSIEFHASGQERAARPRVPRAC